MNTTFILELADLIEAQPPAPNYYDAGYDQSYWAHACGTPSCIAGWAIAKAHGVENIVEFEARAVKKYLVRLMTSIEDEEYPSFFSLGRVALGINQDQAEELFHGGVYATPQQAAEILRLIAQNTTDEPILWSSIGA